MGEAKILLFAELKMNVKSRLNHDIK